MRFPDARVCVSEREQKSRGVFFGGEGRAVMDTGRLDCENKRWRGAEGWPGGDVFIAGEL